MNTFRVAALLFAAFFVSAFGQVKPPPSGGGSITNLIIQQNGTNVTTSVTTFNFSDGNLMAPAISTAGQIKINNSIEFGGPNTPVNLIWDIDAGTDIDDGFDLMELLQLQEQGNIRLLALTSSLTNLFSTPAIEVFTRYFKRNIPIGTSATQTFDSADAWGTSLKNEFTNGLLTSTNSQNSVTLVRRILASSPDNSVIWAFAGQLRNLRDVWYSPADTYSTLGGSNLIGKKISKLMICGGFWPSSGSPGEYNFTTDASSAAVLTLISNVPVRYVGIELGTFNIGQTLYNDKTPGNPAREAYRFWADYSAIGYNVGRVPWAGLMALYIANGNGSAYRGTNYFSESPAGYGIVNTSNGTNSFTTNVVGNHKYLFKTQTDAFYQTTLNNLLLMEPMEKQAQYLSIAAGTYLQPSLVTTNSTTNGFFGSTDGFMGYAAQNIEWLRMFGYNQAGLHGGIVFDGYDGGMWWLSNRIGSSFIRTGISSDGGTRTGLRVADYTNTNTLGYMRFSSLLMNPTNTSNVGFTNYDNNENVRFTGNLHIDGVGSNIGQLIADPGTTGNPGLTFEGDNTAGFYHPLTNAIGVVITNIEWLRFFGFTTPYRGGMVMDGNGGGIWWTSNAIGSSFIRTGIAPDGGTRNGLRIADYTDTNTLGYMRAASMLVTATNTAGITNLGNTVVITGDGLNLPGTGFALVTLTAGVNYTNAANAVGITNSMPVTMQSNVVFNSSIVQAIKALAALDVDWSNASTFTKTIGANSTFTFSNAIAGQWITVKVTASGAYTATWPTITWRAGSAPTQTASKSDFYTFFFDGSTYWGSASQNY